MDYIIEMEARWWEVFVSSSANLAGEEKMRLILAQFMKLSPWHCRCQWSIKQYNQGDLIWKQEDKKNYKPSLQGDACCVVHTFQQTITTPQHLQLFFFFLLKKEKENSSSL